MLVPTPGWLRDVPLAHQGLHGDDVPGNSLAAFAAAAAARVGVELDVRRSADGVPVVVHDPDLRGVAGRPDRVDALAADALAAVGVPTLAAALRVLADVPVMVEVKNPTTRPGLLEPAVAALVDGRDRTCVASFNPRSLTWFRHRAPHVVRVLTAGPLVDVPVPVPVRWALRSLRWLRRVAPAAVAYDVRGLEQPAVQRYRRAGGTVVAWTVRSHDELVRARRWSDNVIFEDLAPADVLGVRRGR